MESVLLEPMYEVPGSDVAFVLITEGKVKGTESARYWKRGEGNEFWHEFANLEQAYRSRMGRRI
ncbi:hypothetical protein FB107DRAFT_266192 [Schizophyllum commune]